jgi:hypothetical protein
MTRALTLLTGASLLTFALACGSADLSGPTVEPVEATVEEQAGAVAKAVDADPSGLQAALEANGLTAETYEAALYEIATDPARTKAFEKARAAK